MHRPKDGIIIVGNDGFVKHYKPVNPDIGTTKIRALKELLDKNRGKDESDRDDQGP